MKITKQPVDIKPDYTKLIEQGYKKNYEPSDYMWNTASNEWQDRKDFDMVEAKDEELQYPFEEQQPYLINTTIGVIQ